MFIIYLHYYWNINTLPHLAHVLTATVKRIKTLFTQLNTNIICLSHSCGTVKVISRVKKL